MFLKKYRAMLMLPLILILAACSSLNLPGSSSNASSQQAQAQGQPGQPPNFANQPLEQKLAIGTLKLEGTSNAVTAEQAKTLLPLWKAERTMSRQSSTSPEELTALYKQIEESMTPQQLQAIKDLNLNQEDIQALMKQYNVQFPQMGSRTQSGTPSARTRSSRSGTAGGQGQAGGFPPAGDTGGPPPDGGGFGGGFQPNAQNAQGTPIARGTPRAGGFRGGGMNFIFINPLVTVLEQRAGVPAEATPTPGK